MELAFAEYIGLTAGALTTPAIEISDLWFAYGGVRVLDQVNLTLPAGDFLAVLGPNGGGKSTLLKLLLGLLKPGGGVVRVLGQPAGQSGGRIGYLPQYTQVSAHFPITVLGATGGTRRQRCCPRAAHGL